jgi:hypothetical protein
MREKNNLTSAKLSTGIKLFVLATIVFIACKKEVTRIEPEVPENPFPIVIDTTPEEVVLIDSNSFLGIHKFILQPTCAVSGCHDGSFEPDYRNVQSSYNTLVYQPTINNDELGSFDYRVKPFDTAASWLHERITTENTNLGRMPLYDDPLTQKEIGRINNWIMSGAQDIYGNSPALPNIHPAFWGMVAFVNNLNGERLDTLRGGDDYFVNPIPVPQNSTIQFLIGLYDVDTEDNYYPASSFTYNKVRISESQFDFSESVELDMQVRPEYDPYISANPYDESVGYYYHSFSINTTGLIPGKRYYFRVYVQDPGSTAPTEIPDPAIYWLQAHFSFKVQ